jgi:lipid-A-disaccharide synthase
MTNSPHIMLVVGEPSGDLLGAQIMLALQSLTDNHVRITGLGGDEMTKLGLASLFSLEATAVMGLQEVIPKIPVILRRIREVADYAAKEKPDAVVLIDAPDFTHRVAKRLKKIAPDIPVIKYVAPQVWATRPWRAKKLGRIIDHQLALLPFEPTFFEGYGLPTTFVGHPAVERIDQGNAEDFKARHGISEDVTTLAVLIGSRNTEIKYMAETFRETVAMLTKEVEGLHCVLPTVPHVAHKVRALAETWPTPVTVVEGPEEKAGAFAACEVALATSGTVSTELAIANVPTVIAYKLGTLTAYIVLKILNTEYVTLINIIQDKAVMPEFIQHEATPENLSRAVAKLLLSEDERHKQHAEMTLALKEMGMGDEAPSVRAAKAILDIIEG